VDGATGGLQIVYDSKWHEIFKFVTVIEFVMSIDGINVNLDAWKELPPEYQKVVLETGKKWQYKYWLKRETETVTKNVLAQRNYNVRVRYMDPDVRKKLTALCKEKVWPDWVARTGDPVNANAYIKDVEKYRDEFLSMPKKGQIDWLKQNQFPIEALD